MVNYQELYDCNVLSTYQRYPVSFAKGKGCRLWDAEGKEYIDFAAGIGVSSVGYAHPDWVAAVSSQASELAHVSNLFYTLPGGRLAQRLCLISGMGGAFFSNSGAEANEGLFKLARKYSLAKHGEGRSTILTLTGSFHGRTITALAATGQERFHQNFGPFTPGFRHVPPGDVEALVKEAALKDVCALLLEPIQGEGGVNLLESDYVRKAQAICAEHDWLLLFDEVQTGIGRTGHWFGFQDMGVMPDALSFAKGIAGGLPMGGFLVSERLKGVLAQGDHATTFGGNLVCAAAALATLDILEPILPQVIENGEYIRTRIEEMKLPCVGEIRGKGLMIGVKIDGPSPASVNSKLLQAGVVCLTAGSDVIRLLPPLVIGKDDINAGLEIFEHVLKNI